MLKLKIQYSLINLLKNIWQISTFSKSLKFLDAEEPSTTQFCHRCLWSMVSTSQIYFFFFWYKARLNILKGEASAWISSGNQDWHINCAWQLLVVIQRLEGSVIFNDNHTMEALWPLNMKDQRVHATQITSADLKSKSCFSRWVLQSKYHVLTGF